MRNRTFLTIASMLLSGALLAAPAAVTLHAAEHAHHGAGAPKLSLNAGKKWATDAPLRKGMSAIRTALAADLDAIHTGKQTDPRYDALAKQVTAQVAYIVANCKLDKEADEMLHLVIADVVAGADVMAGKDPAASRQSGAVRLVQALDAYGSHFDHAGWRPLKH